MIRVLDLFAGACGGWSLGLHRAGPFQTVAAVEIDPWRRAVFSRNFPKARMYDDVRTVTAGRLAGDGIAVDWIVGSPPCQDASTANSKGRGVDGARTGLFFEAIRLVRELRPRWCAFENVAGLRARGVDRVLSELEAADYAVWPLVVGARHAGAPHKRDRVWIVAKSKSVGRGQGRPGRSDPGHARQREQAFQNADPAPVFGAALARRESDGINAGAVADAEVEQMEWRGSPREHEECGHDAIVVRHANQTHHSISESKPAEPPGFPPTLRTIGEAWPGWNGGVAGISGLDDGLPRGVARSALAAYGDAVVPQITEAIGRAILRFDAAAAERVAA